METPFYERTLDSFADEIITKIACKTSAGVYYAVLDVPDGSNIGADFSTGRSKAEDATAACARKIRDDHRGIGKFAPHSCLQGYDLKFRLMKHWSEKERYEQHGSEETQGMAGVR